VFAASLDVDVKVTVGCGRVRIVVSGNRDRLTVVIVLAFVVDVVGIPSSPAWSRMQQELLTTYILHYEL
jgi:hypothetical protein